jgi:hypothetical protein
VSLETVVCYQVEVSASGWSLVRRRPNECDVSEREVSIMRRPWHTVGLLHNGGGEECCTLDNKYCNNILQLSEDCV